MISEAITKLQELFSEAGKPVLLTVGDYANRFYILGGEVRPIAPPLPCRVVNSLDDLIAYAGRTAENAEANVLEVYYSFGSVVLLPNADDSRIQVQLRLPYSKRWCLLRELAAAPKALDHRQFIRLLYVDLGLESAIITPWRKIDFNSMCAVTGEVARGRDRMGKAVTSEAIGADQLPEVIPVTVPIYDVHGEREIYTVECRVDVDSANLRITLLPDPIALNEVEERHLGTIANRLTAGLPAEVGVYFGSV